jgi:hypothetical protein
MSHHYNRTGSSKEDRIANRWGAVLSEDPIPSMRFASPINGNTNTALTVVYHHKRFDSETQRLDFLLNYDTEARDAVLQSNNERREKGWFVRPPAVQPTEKHLKDMTTLQEQVSTIWPCKFYTMYEDEYFLKMIMKVPIDGPTRRDVRHQDIAGRRQGLGAFSSLSLYLNNTEHSRPGTRDSHLSQYETMVGIPTPESRTIMQIYVSGGSKTNLDDIPLLDYLGGAR